MPSVVLRQIFPGAPLVFDCSRLHASLAPAACAENFLGELCLQCVGCQIGREHAQCEPRGQEISNIRWARSEKCIRCETSGPRRLVANLCLSCWNRQSEVLRGANAKGSFPHAAAAMLHTVHGLVEGDIQVPEGRTRANGHGSPRYRLMTGGALISTVATGRDEFLRWLSRRHPGAELVDFEIGSSLEAASRAAFEKRQRSRDSNINSSPTAMELE